MSEGRKRGRPRKNPLPEDATPNPVSYLPVVLDDQRRPITPIADAPPPPPLDPEELAKRNAAIREQIRALNARPALKAAGYKIRDLKKSLVRTKEALDAITVKHHVYQGRIIETTEHVDHATRLRAAEMLQSMIEGVQPKKQEEGQRGNLVVEILSMADNKGTAIRIKQGDD